MLCYLIENKINGKKYVGITSRTLKYRMTQHFSDAKRKDSYLYRAMRKYGRENFIVTVLVDYVGSYEELKSIEIKQIALLNTFVSGYNRTLGGDGTLGLSRPMLEETKNKISAAHKGKSKSKEHEEALRIASSKRRGVPLSEEHKKKIGEARRGIIPKWALGKKEQWILDHKIACKGNTPAWRLGPNAVEIE